jgi:hypothetical protein
MKIPVYEALITNEDEGILNISLVDLPAVDSNFLAFREEQKELKFEIQSEEQRLITGVVMRANFNIYKEDPKYGPFYIRYSPETIKIMAEKIFMDGNQNSINIMHLPDSNVEGVNLIQLFIKDSEKGVAPVGFENIEDGSLFATYHVENDSVWNEIKNGTFKGFSLEGLFRLEKLNLKKEEMSLKTKFLKALLKFGEVATDKGTIYWPGEEDLKAGDEVFNEAYEPLEDGEYQTEDQKVIVVVDGRVSEIRDPEAEVSGEPKEEEFAEEVISEEPAEVIVEEPASEEEVRDLEKELDELKAEVEELKRALDSIKEQLAEPVAEPIAEEFKKTNVKDFKGNKAAKILAHLKD